MDRKTSGRFSWADEVEKEEEEEEKAQAHLLHQQKPTKRPNPFGSARPREIVLQERGIDWRNLDHQLQSSNLRSSSSPPSQNPLFHLSNPNRSFQLIIKLLHVLIAANLTWAVCFLHVFGCNLQLAT